MKTAALRGKLLGGYPVSNAPSTQAQDGLSIMKIHVLSDLHIEFGDLRLPDSDSDVAVLAGDTHCGKSGVRWAKQAFANKPVAYILGNHEPYGGALPKLLPTLREEASDSQVKVLENDEWILGDVRILGCTLWTDFQLMGHPVMSSSVAQTEMTDYYKIRVDPTYRKLRPSDTASFHRRSRHWLEEKLREPCHGRTVVVTHHAPSPRSLGPHLKGDHVSAAYASDMENLVAASGASVWIHGHIHTASDYQIGETRVICNPRGYLDDPTAGFQPGLVIEV
jgi:predicted phosphodiesterase